MLKNIIPIYLESLDFADGGDRFNAELLDFLGPNQSLVGNIDILVLDRVLLHWDSGADSHSLVALDGLHMIVFHRDDFLSLDVPLNGHLDLKKG